VSYAEFYLGVALARENQWQGAIPHFRKIVQSAPKSPLADRAVYEWAWCEKGLNRAAEAAKQYAHLLKTYPKSELFDRASFELGELESEGGKLDSAIGRLAQVLTRVKGDLRGQVLYRLGWCYLAKGDHQKSAELLEQLMKEYPQSDVLGLARYHAGEACLKLKEYERSRDHFQQAVADERVPPDFKEMALLRLGETQGLTKQWPESEASYAAFLKSYPKSEWLRRARLGLGWARENQKKYQEAMQAYREVLAAKKRDDTSARAQFQIGECHFALRDYDNALRELLKVEVSYAYPEWVSKAMLEMGRVLEAKGEKVRAVEQYELLVEKHSASDAAAVAKDRIKELLK
jgi:TolA-binding protein